MITSTILCIPRGLALCSVQFVPAFMDASPAKCGPKSNGTATVPLHQGAPLRILPLGDSITFGYDELSEKSYRRYLKCLLHSGGNPVTLIGSIQHGDWANNLNDGFNLHTIDQNLEAGTPELTRKAEGPNIILLHAGTVNFVLKLNVTNAVSRLSNLVDFITEHNPAALLVVAQLIPNANATTPSFINHYNSQVPEVVQSRAQSG
ncbi:uncharacterized protein N7498_004458 [Penicillium cinerascens]|uniref:SGNH hydrolase-type esterase domain-containing protein n=1 Tax=Penicillium cinerascens TaxID=70096 RepID=A0A9W9N441_9EURO|nr:uncharacterized protein N7498_004458 [Penicillium cinerascens]KAJ5212812.1 hypothetical protein N7498_004458 [Penicillium cinerascens]